MEGGAAGEPTSESAGQAGFSGPNVHCEPSILGGCLCVADPNHAFPPDTLSCTSSSSAFCCAQLLGYPDRGTCECDPWSCTANSTECACGGASGGTLTTCPDTYTHCCKDPVSKLCSCTNGLAECAVGSKLVANCVLEDVECFANETRVASCKGSVTGIAGSAGISGGGAAGGGATSGGAAGGAGGPPNITCKDLPFCDGFESSTVGAAADPALWSPTTCTACTTVAPVVDIEQQHGGIESLKVTGSGEFYQPVMIAPKGVLPAVGPTVYGRFYVLFGAPLPSGTPGIMLSFFDQTPNEVVSFVNSNGSLAWHRASTDRILPDDIVGLNVKPSENRWYCVETKLDETQGTVDTWLDGSALPQVTLGFSPNPISISLGWRSDSGKDFVLWFDDIAFAAQRIGCCLSDSDCRGTERCNLKTHSCSMMAN